MTVLVIRASKRFAVCKSVRLRASHKSARSGLMIELSLEGCRISQLGRNTSLETGAEVTLDLGQGQQLPAVVRWSHDGQAGLRLLKPLHRPELCALIEQCRLPDEICVGQPAMAAAR